LFLLLLCSITALFCDKTDENEPRGQKNPRAGDPSEHKEKKSFLLGKVGKGVNAPDIILARLGSIALRQREAA
jgi:hypothetical protein